MKTFFKRLALCIGGLLVLLILFHLVENWRGKRAWLQWKASREAGGDSYDLARLIPPEVPEADNFACAPRIAEAVTGSKGPAPALPALPAIFSKAGALLEWRTGQKTDLEGLKAELKTTDLKEIVAPWETELAALTEAAKRPHCRLVKNYENTETMPALLGMRARARMLALRALIALSEKREAAALEDVFTGLRVAAHFQQEPHLLSQLLRIAWMNLLMQPIWEGLQEHRWSAAQLALLQERLNQIDLVSSYKAGWQFERVFYMVQSAEKMAETAPWSRHTLFSDQAGENHLRTGLIGLWLPTGWLYQNLLRTDQHNAAQFHDVLHPESHRIEVRASQTAEKNFAKTRRTPYTFISLMGSPALAGQNLGMARTQCGLDLAVIACALERYRLEKGRYPENLEALTPGYLAIPPVDVLEGQPLRYTPKGKDAFQLYSLGWNLTDEGGLSSPKESAEQGDWVWNR